jgi:hypothetical protein
MNIKASKSEIFLNNTENFSCYLTQTQKKCYLHYKDQLIMINTI